MNVFIFNQYYDSPKDISSQSKIDLQLTITFQGWGTDFDYPFRCKKSTKTQLQNPVD